MVELKWDAPFRDGGAPITGYFNIIVDIIVQYIGLKKNTFTLH